MLIYTSKQKLSSHQSCNCKRAHYKARNRPESEITSPSPAWADSYFWSPIQARKANYTEWIKICATAGYQKT